MLIVVVAMFGVCWMPLHILNVILNFRTETSSRADDNIAAIYISAHWLAMANSFANPIIYSFTNSIFRVKLLVLPNISLFIPTSLCNLYYWENIKLQHQFQVNAFHIFFSIYVISFEFIVLRRGWKIAFFVVFLLNLKEHVGVQL